MEGAGEVNYRRKSTVIDYIGRPLAHSAADPDSTRPIRYKFGGSSNLLHEEHRR